MALLYLVRHGRAAGGWDSDLDPPLHTEGAEQAEAVAKRLAGGLVPDGGPLPIVTSPMRRCRETAIPLERVWGAAARTEPGVSEIPSPTQDLQERTEWLRGLMRGLWDETPAPTQAWRNRVVETLSGLTEDTVVFTHFIAINVAVGEAQGRPETVVFKPGYCSVTILKTGDGGFAVERLGEQSDTIVR